MKGTVQYTTPPYISFHIISGADLGGVHWFRTNPPFCCFIRLTGSLLLPAVFDTQRWRASPVWLLYNLRAIQFNAHAVK